MEVGWDARWAEVAAARYGLQLLKDAGLIMFGSREMHSTWFNRC